MLRASEQSIQGSAGNLFVRGWRSSEAPRAVVAICHGFNAHSGMYAWCGERFAQNGIAAYALDLRGRGNSEGERFYVERFEEYVDDLSRLIQFAKSRAVRVPVFLLGHSAGGVTGCLYALEHPSEIAGLICEDFSRDPEVVKLMNEDPLIAHEIQPFATMAAIVRADERLKTSFHKITLPVLIIHGDADRAAKPSGSRRFYEQAESGDKTLKIYEGRYHDPLRDIGKEEVFADILAWIEARLPA